MRCSENSSLALGDCRKHEVLHLLQSIIPQEEQAHNLHRGELSELFPVKLDAHYVSLLLLLLGIVNYLLDSLIDDILGVSVKDSHGVAFLNVIELREALGLFGSISDELLSLQLEEKAT